MTFALPASSSALPAPSVDATASVAEVVLLSADPVLTDEVQRLALAAGVALTVRTESAPFAERAALLLVGADLAGQVAGRRPSWGRHRSGVVLVGTVAPSSRGGAGEPAGELWRQAVALGAEQVALLPEAGEWLVHRLGRTVERSGRATVVGVVGGSGGAGASLLAVALATTSAFAGSTVLLVDLDPLGGGLDLPTGLVEVAGLRWPDLVAVQGRLPASSLHESLPRVGRLAVLSWGRGEPLDLPARAVGSVLEAGGRGHDLVVVDLPRGLDAAADAALGRLDELFVVVPARVRAVVAAGQVVDQLRSRTSSVRAVVRRAPGERWSPRRVADALGLPLAAELRDEPRLDDDIDRGELPGRRSRGGLARAAEQCLATLCAPQAA